MSTLGRTSISLHAGEVFVGDGRYCVQTLLGSCVAITLWHPRARVGAMCHFVLPTRLRPPAAPGNAADGRFGDEALQIMRERLLRLGAAAADCEAYVVGGASMFARPLPSLPELLGPGAAGGIGQRNGESARALLQRAGVIIRGESLFGACHRVVTLDIASGQVQIQEGRPVADGRLSEAA